MNKLNNRPFIYIANKINTREMKFQIFLKLGMAILPVGRWQKDQTQLQSKNCYKLDLTQMFRGGLVR
jgi:hypothetical protein